MNINNKLESRLLQYNSEFNNLMNNPSMRNACFTSAGCGNRATQRKLTSYRNKLGELGNKIKAIELALKIVKQEPFIHNDIINIYNYFLQARNPELYFTICDRCSTFDAIKKVITLIIELFLPIGKSQVLCSNLLYDNENGNIFTLSLN